MQTNQRSEVERLAPANLRLFAAAVAVAALRRRPDRSAPTRGLSHSRYVPIREGAGIRRVLGLVRSTGDPCREFPEDAHGRAGWSSQQALVTL